MQTLDQTVGPWTWSQLLAAFTILVASFIVRFIVVTLISRRLQRLARRTRTEADDMAVTAVAGA